MSRPILDGTELEILNADGLVVAELDEVAWSSTHTIVYDGEPQVVHHYKTTMTETPLGKADRVGEQFGEAFDSANEGAFAVYDQLQTEICSNFEVRNKATRQLLEFGSIDRDAAIDVVWLELLDGKPDDKIGIDQPPREANGT